MNLREIEPAPFSVGSDPTAKGRIGLPVCADNRALTTVVYLEVDPGDHIPLHTHSAEETLVFLEGTGHATAGSVEVDVSAGSIVVVLRLARLCATRLRPAGLCGAEWGRSS